MKERLIFNCDTMVDESQEDLDKFLNQVDDIRKRISRLSSLIQRLLCSRSIGSEFVI